MVQKNTNSNLHQAKNAKKDEFYTQLPGYRALPPTL